MTAEELVIANQKLVYDVYARRFYAYVSEKEDLLQEGRLALWQAANRYDVNKAKFSTYAYTCIFGAMNRYVRSQTTCIHISAKEYENQNRELYNLARHYVSLDVQVGDDEEDTMYGLLEGELDDHKSLTVDLVYKFLDTVENARNRDILEQYYMAKIRNEKISQAKIGEKYGLSQTHTSYIIRHANDDFKRFIS